MDVLGQLSEQTNGNVTRVNQSDIVKDFASILKTGGRDASHPCREDA
jgi:hypothetical protein